MHKLTLADWMVCTAQVLNCRGTDSVSELLMVYPPPLPLAYWSGSSQTAVFDVGGDVSGPPPLPPPPQAARKQVVAKRGASQKGDRMQDSEMYELVSALAANTLRHCPPKAKPVT